eukprot:COSAG03_NODE_3850_length_1795_cov_3.417453_2_plen_47_part_00
MLPSASSRFVSLTSIISLVEVMCAAFSGMVPPALLAMSASIKACLV